MYEIIGSGVLAQPPRVYWNAAMGDLGLERRDLEDVPEGVNPLDDPGEYPNVVAVYRKARVLCLLRR